MSSLDDSLVIELLEEPAFTWGDRWRNWKQKILSNLQYTAPFFAYIPLTLWVLLYAPSRSDLVFRLVVDVLFYIGVLLFGAAFIVVSSQTILLNQIKGSGKDVIEAEIIFPNLSYGITIQNVIMYYVDIKNEPILFNTIIQDYNRRKRIIEWGNFESEIDNELVYENGRLLLGSDPEVKEKRYESFMTWITRKIFRKPIEISEDSKNYVLKCEKCNIIRPLPEHCKQLMTYVVENKNAEFRCSNKKCDYSLEIPICEKCSEKMTIIKRSDAYVVHTRTGTPILVSEESHPEMYEQIIKQIEVGESDNKFNENVYDFRSYLENYDLFFPPLLESGFWKLLLVKFRSGYVVGNSYPKSMFILSREDSLDKLFPSTSRFIELEGVVGESVVYHTIFILLGFWRNIPICLPIHTREKIELAYNRNARYNELEPHVHQFDKETGLCTVEIQNEKGGKIVCGRSLESLIRQWYYSEIAPTDEEIVGAQNRAEVSLTKFYFTSARDYEIKMQEQSTLLNQLLERGTRVNVEMLDIDNLIGREEETLSDKAPTWLLIAGSLIVGYVIGYLRLLRMPW